MIIPLKNIKTFQVTIHESKVQNIFDCQDHVNVENLLFVIHK